MVGPTSRVNVFRTDQFFDVDGGRIVRDVNTLEIFCIGEFIAIRDMIMINTAPIKRIGAAT
jgi:hypothetical protein